MSSWGDASRNSTAAGSSSGPNSADADRNSQTDNCSMISVGSSAVVPDSELYAEMCRRVVTKDAEVRRLRELLEQANREVATRRMPGGKHVDAASATSLLSRPRTDLDSRPGTTQTGRRSSTGTASSRRLSTAASPERQLNEVHALLNAAEMGMAVAEEQRDHLAEELRQERAANNVLRTELYNTTEKNLDEQEKDDVTRSIHPRSGKNTCGIEGLQKENAELLEQLNAARKLCRPPIDALKKAIHNYRSDARLLREDLQQFSPATWGAAILDMISSVQRMSSEESDSPSVYSKVLKQVQSLCDDRASKQQDLDATTASLRESRLELGRLKQQMKYLENEFKMKETCFLRENDVMASKVASLSKMASNYVTKLNDLLPTTQLASAVKNSQQTLELQQSNHRLEYIGRLSQELEETRREVLYLEAENAKLRESLLVQRQHNNADLDADDSIDSAKRKCQIDRSSALDVSQLSAELATALGREKLMRSQVDALKAEVANKDSLAARIMELESELSTRIDESKKIREKDISLEKLSQRCILLEHELKKSTQIVNELLAQRGQHPLYSCEDPRSRLRVKLQEMDSLFATATQ